MIERVSWEQFKQSFDWHQGEHVSMIGPTNCGKTTLAINLVKDRKYAVALGMKPEDDTLDALVRSGWKRIERITDRPRVTRDYRGGMPPQRFVLWPRFKRMSDRAKHAPRFREAMDRLFVERRWTVFADEVYYLSRTCKLSDDLGTWWFQGRSIKLTLVGATQRPAWVPVEMYSQATHMFLWNTNDRRDLKRLSDIQGPMKGSDIEEVIRGLDFVAHEVLYVDTRTGRSVVTVPPGPPLA